MGPGKLPKLREFPPRIIVTFWTLISCSSSNARTNSGSCNAKGEFHRNGSILNHRRKICAKNDASASVPKKQKQQHTTNDHLCVDTQSGITKNAPKKWCWMFLYCFSNHLDHSRTRTCPTSLKSRLSSTSPSHSSVCKQ